MKKQKLQRILQKKILINSFEIEMRIRFKKFLRKIMVWLIKKFLMQKEIKILNKIIIVGLDFWGIIYYKYSVVRL